jgi:hypothetical protein
MMRMIKLGSLLTAIVLAGACGDDSGEDGDADADADMVPDSDDGTPAGSCAAYCTQIQTNCTGDNAQYESEADCLAYCDEVDWPAGVDGEMSGNTLACRIYHSGVPAAGAPIPHCPHGGPTGDTVCGTVDFRANAAGDYTRVDAAGVPGVSKFLVPAAQASAYNDASPDSTGSANAFTSSIAALHTALNADIAAMNFDTCNGNNCVQQDYQTGSTVQSLFQPTDRLTVTPTATQGFPNGRSPSDQVMDIMLAMILLDLEGGTCGAGPCTSLSFAQPAATSINPPANDAAFSTSFPYLAPAHP